MHALLLQSGSRKACDMAAEPAMAKASCLPAPLLEKLLCDAMWVRVSVQVHWRDYAVVTDHRDVQGYFHCRRDGVCQQTVLDRAEQWRLFIPSVTARVRGDVVMIRLEQVGVRQRQAMTAVSRSWASAVAATLRRTWRLRVPEFYLDIFDRASAIFMRVHAAHLDMLQLRKGVSVPLALCLGVKQGSSYTRLLTKAPVRDIVLRARAADFKDAAERKFLRRLISRWRYTRMLSK